MGMSWLNIDIPVFEGNQVVDNETILKNGIRLDGDNMLLPSGTNTLMSSDTNDMPPNDLTNDHNMVPIDERNEENVTEAKHALEESPHFSVPGHSPENFLEVSNSSSSFITIRWIDLVVMFCLSNIIVGSHLIDILRIKMTEGPNTQFPIMYPPKGCLNL